MALEGSRDIHIVPDIASTRSQGPHCGPTTDRCWFVLVKQFCNFSCLQSLGGSTSKAFTAGQLAKVIQSLRLKCPWVQEGKSAPTILANSGDNCFLISSFVLVVLSRLPFACYRKRLSKHYSLLRFNALRAPATKPLKVVCPFFGSVQ